jgi:hypothetical protein
MQTDRVKIDSPHMPPCVRGSAGERALEEPGEFRWVLKPRGDELGVQVLWFGDPAGPRESLHAECSLAAFCNAIAKGAQAVLEEHGFDGYKARWIQRDFLLDH